ncbi:Transcriptional regulator ure2 [Conoideocrella luteorostrata]|uniref:glutathione transferase n=1 Tax=Conoideocrella luteorostrata TaxID=1105319 RepID=A0AAJ0FQB8_9HYPO|nr:Transcriptional regulator ure2 [Conoideocrella luteorostrata]
MRLADYGILPLALLFFEELGLPYEIESIRFENIKQPPLTDINPNGRVPAIEDPNTGITVWETGAIIQYLIKQYDTERLLSYDSLKEYTQCSQWLFFQVSGHGPFVGQAGWFQHLHQEKLPSAIERYVNEVRRVLGVLESVLSKKPAPQWLVGDRITYADLSFLPWNERLDVTLGVPREQMFDGFPIVKDWHERMASRLSWKKCMEIRARLMEDQGLDWHGMPKDTKSFQQYEADIAAKHAEANKAAASKE